MSHFERESSDSSTCKDTLTWIRTAKDVEALVLKQGLVDIRNAFVRSFPDVVDDYLGLSQACTDMVDTTRCLLPSEQISILRSSQHQGAQRQRFVMGFMWSWRSEIMTLIGRRLIVLCLSFYRMCSGNGNLKFVMRDRSQRLKKW